MFPSSHHSNHIRPSARTRPIYSQSQDTHFRWWYECTRQSRMGVSSGADSTLYRDQSGSKIECSATIQARVRTQGRNGRRVDSVQQFMCSSASTRAGWPECEKVLPGYATYYRRLRLQVCRRSSRFARRRMARHHRLKGASTSRRDVTKTP